MDIVLEKMELDINRGIKDYKGDFNTSEEPPHKIIECIVDRETQNEFEVTEQRREDVEG